MKTAMRNALIVGVLLCAGAPTFAANKTFLLHGWNGAPSGFDRMTALLVSDGGWLSEDIIAGDYSDVPDSYTIEQVSFEVADDLAAVRNANGFKPVDVVCHSMGGLVVRTILAQRDSNAGGGGSYLFEKAWVQRFITLGTPHYGHWWTVAWLTGGSDNQRAEMYMGSLFLWDLALDWQNPTKSLALSSVLSVVGRPNDVLYDESDGVVPYWSAALADTTARYVDRYHTASASLGTRPLVECRGADDIANTSDDVQDPVYRLIKSFLTTGTVLPQADCGITSPHLPEGSIFLRVLNSLSAGVDYDANVVNSVSPSQSLDRKRGDGAWANADGLELLRRLPVNTYAATFNSSSGGVVPAFTANGLPANAGRTTIQKVYAPETVPPRVISRSYSSARNTNIEITFAPDSLNPGTFPGNVTVSGSSSGSHGATLTYTESQYKLNIDPTSDFSFGETVTVTLTTGIQDMRANGLDGDGNGTVGPNYLFTFPIESAPQFTINASAGSNGSIDPSGSVGVASGATRTYNASPSSGYEVDKWYWNGGAVQTGGTSYTTPAVYANASVYVTFKQSVSSSLTVTSPNGGIYGRGNRIYINWTWGGPIGARVKIELLKGGSVNRTITADYSNSGSYTWQVPDDQALGTDYRMRVSSASDTPTDESDSNFEITTRVTPPSRIELRTLTDLRNMTEQWGTPSYPRDGYYVLMNDIAARDTRDWNGGKGWKPIGNGYSDWFRGTFDGQGFKITRLYCRRPTEAYAAFFAVTIDNATVKNIKLEYDDCYGEGYKNRGGVASGGVGGIAGENAGLIKNCHVYAERMYVTNGNHVAGIAGENYRGTIENCSVYGLTEISARGPANDSDTVGGIAGENSGLIRWCSVGADVDLDGDVYGSNGDRVGGIVGNNYGQVVECESRAKWTDGDQHIGGIVGEQSTGAFVQDCVFRAGSVDGSRYLGGVAGENDGGTIRRCYVSGSVMNSTTRGSLVGLNNSLVEDSFWNTDVVSYPATGNGGGTVVNCEGKTTAQLRQQATFVTWDFSNVWQISEGADFPALRGVGTCLAPLSGVSGSSGLADGVHLSWNSVTDAQCYRVFRSDTADGTKEPLGPWAGGLTFIDSSAAPGATYYYWVKAASTTNGARESEYSGSATGSRTEPPLAPPSTVSASDGQPTAVVVTWATVAGASHYRVYRAESSTGTQSAVTGWISDNSLVDSPATARHRYSYWVQAATDSSGTRASTGGGPDEGYFILADNTPPSVTVSNAPVQPIETQPVSIGVQATDNDMLDRVTLHWQTPGVSTQTWASLATNQYHTSHGIGSFDAGVEVIYWAEGWDEAGNRVESEHRSLTVQAETVSVPPVPTGPSIVYLSENNQFTASGSSSSLGAPTESQLAWDDGQTSTWTTVSLQHAWPVEGFYAVRARSRSQPRPANMSGWSGARTVHVRDWNKDYDDDGMTDAQEAIAGTDSSSCESCFQFQDVQTGITGNFHVLHWPSVSNRFYHLKETFDLGAGFGGYTASNMDARPPMNSYTTTVHQTPTFYRVDVTTNRLGQ
jgi:pimeloyl-ACP methyl ester carboxylesterase